MNDVIAFAMERAVVRYGPRGEDGLFSAACFSEAMLMIAGVDGVLDGRIVRAMLTGRPDVEPLGDGMFRRKVPGST